MRAPFLPTACVCACGRGWVGSVGSAPSARHVWGCMSGASSGGGAAAGLLRYSQRGPLARDVTTEYSRGTPSLWGTVRGYRRGTWLLWVRRSTAERPSPLRVCSALYNNALNGSVPSSLSALTHLGYLCVPPSCHGGCACGRCWLDRSALLRARRMSGFACRRHRAGPVRQQGCCGTLRGDLGHAM